MHTISQDGYIHLTLAQLRAVPLRHLISGLDEVAPDSECDATAADNITGYTEWISSELPQISLGWDWIMSVKDGQVVLSRVGTPRSNCMLQDEQLVDLGYVASENVLKTFVDALAWQDDTASHIKERYKPG